MREVILGQPDGDHVAMRVLRRKHPRRTDYWDGNWVDAEVTIVFRPWRGTFNADLRTDEFAHFRQELVKLSNGARPEAMFAPLEPWLKLTLELGSLGQVNIKGVSGPEGFGRVFNEAFLEFDIPGFIEQASLPACRGRKPRSRSRPLHSKRAQPPGQEARSESITPGLRGVLASPGQPGSARP